MEVGDRSRPPARKERPDTQSPLAGIRVLDLCIILAGPACGRSLAEFGADVIKIDDPHRPTNVYSSTDVNRGKRSILLDLKTPEGLAVFWELLDTADVVIENFRQGKLEALGIGYEAVRKRRPDVVYASLNAFGYGGPWSDRPGWEQNAQAVSGIQVRHGGRGHRPRLLAYPVNDYGTGLLGAYGIILALLDRTQTGDGQQVRTGLAAAAGLMQSRYFVDFPGYVRNDLEGPDLLGESPWSRLYEAYDGWFYLHASADQWDSLVEVLPGLRDDIRFSTPQQRMERRDELEAALEESFSGMARTTVLDALQRSGIAAGEKRVLADIEKDEHVRSSGLVVTRDHPNIGRVQHTGPVAQMSDTPMALGRPTPRFGADTYEILHELGYEREQVHSLERVGAIRAYESEPSHLESK